MGRKLLDQKVDLRCPPYHPPQPGRKGKNHEQSCNVQGKTFGDKTCVNSKRGTPRKAGVDTEQWAAFGSWMWRVSGGTFSKVQATGILYSDHCEDGSSLVFLLLALLHCPRFY